MEWIRQIELPLLRVRWSDSEMWIGGVDKAD